MPGGGPGHRRRHGRGRSCSARATARRGARLVQLPRRVPADGARRPPARTTAASPRSIPVRLAREMAGEDGVVVAVDCNSGTRWPAADSFVALALRAGLTLLRGRTRGELAGADLVIAPAMGESGWMQPRKIPSFFEAGRARRCVEALPELRRLLGGVRRRRRVGCRRRRSLALLAAGPLARPGREPPAGPDRRLAGRGRRRAPLRDGRRPARPLRARGLGPGRRAAPRLRFVDLHLEGRAARPGRATTTSIALDLPGLRRLGPARPTSSLDDLPAAWSWA